MTDLKKATLKALEAQHDAIDALRAALGALLAKHPPRRKWRGLTDEEKRLFSSWLDEKPDAEVFGAIEAKLREKNA